MERFLTQFFLVIFSFFIFISNAFSSEVFYKTAKIEPIKISSERLGEVIKRINDHLVSLNIKAKRPENAFRLRIQSGNDSIEYKGDPSTWQFNNLPPISYRLDFEFLSFDPLDVSQISVNFSDFEREISVSGDSADKVESTFLILRESFKDSSSFTGGFVFRMILWVFITILCITFAVSFWNKGNVIQYNILISIPLLLLPLSFLLPLNSWFSGFVLYKGEASFLKRYSAEISFYGILIPLAYSSLLKMIKLLTKDNKGKRKA